MSVILRSSGWDDLQICNFYLPSQAPAHYTMRMATTVAWSHVTINVYAADVTTSGTGAYGLDDVTVTYRPAQSAAKTDCVDPHAPTTGGATLVRHDYLPFGESTSAIDGDPRRFLGQELDAETGFDHFGARQYRNVWGRFAGVDPLVPASALTNPQRWNRYAYALNGPLRYTDPSGLAPESNHLVMEPSSFDYAAFERAAHDLYLDNMFRSFQAGLVQFAALINALPLDQRREFGNHVRFAIAQSMAPLLISLAAGIALPGGFREAGFVTFMSPSGGGMEFLRLNPGPFTVPGPGVEATINLRDIAPGQNPSRLRADWSLSIAVHVHPAGRTRTHQFEQSSGQGDYAALRAAGYPLGIAIGARDHRVYFYNGTGALGSVALDRFLRLF